jgi:hypothetical protein
VAHEHLDDVPLGRGQAHLAICRRDPFGCEVDGEVVRLYDRFLCRRGWSSANSAAAGLLPGPRMQQGQVFELATRRSDGNPLWAYRFRAGGRDSRRVQRGGFRAEADARASLERALEKLRREIGVGRRPTLAEFVDEYLAQHGGLAGDAQSLAACRECPRVTGRALDDVPVSYPRHVVCLRNRRRLCCRRIVEIDIVADPERLRELDLTVLNH